MSGILGDPAPHGLLVTQPGMLAANLPNVAKGGLLLVGIAASSSITVITVGGETVTITLGTVALAYVPLNIQVVQVVAVTGTIASIIALWH